MRSRDGTQTICVACPKDKTDSATDCPKEKIDSTTACLDTATFVVESSRTKTMETTLNNILVLLDSSLHFSDSGQALNDFVEILESALQLFDSIPGNFGKFSGLIESIRGKIGERLQAQLRCTDSCAVVNHFKLLKRLLEASEKLSKY